MFGFAVPPGFKAIVCCDGSEDVVPEGAASACMARGGIAGNCVAPVQTSYGALLIPVGAAVGIRYLFDTSWLTAALVGGAVGVAAMLWSLGGLGTGSH